MTDLAPTTETNRLDRSYLRRNPNLMDEIIPGLYLGSLEAAVDHPLLAANKITHILSLTSTPIPVAPPKNIHHTHHIVRDSKTSNLMEILLSSLETIENAFTGALPILDDSGHPVAISNKSSNNENDTSMNDDDTQRQQVRILVHCRMGISRSASVVLAYLLKHHSHDNLNSALKFLGSVRPCVNPNQGFRSQLEILSSVKFDQDVIQELGLLDLGQTIQNLWDGQEETEQEREQERIQRREAKRVKKEEEEKRLREHREKMWADESTYCSIVLRGWAADEEHFNAEELRSQERTLHRAIKHADKIFCRADHARKEQGWTKEQLVWAYAMPGYDPIPDTPPPVGPEPGINFPDYFPSLDKLPAHTSAKTLRETAEQEWAEIVKRHGGGTFKFNSLGKTYRRAATTRGRMAEIVRTGRWRGRPLRLTEALSGDELRVCCELGSGLEAACRERGVGDEVMEMRGMGGNVGVQQGIETEIHMEMELEEDVAPVGDVIDVDMEGNVQTDMAIDVDMDAPVMEQEGRGGKRRRDDNGDTDMEGRTRGQ